MAWLEITLHTTSDTIEQTASVLTLAGFSDLVLEDQGEMEGFLAQNRAYWDYIDENLQKKLQGLSQIRLYLEDTDTAALHKLTDLVKGMGLSMETTCLADTAWEESWKENYPPQPVGKKLLVLPVWLSNTDPQGRLPVILDPGLTFGTGAHPSTQMVMEALEEAVKPGYQCLDLGSGSGILSITALHLGATMAVGVDIDPKAEDIARENAASNGFFSPEFTAYTGNVLADKALMQRLTQQHWDLVLVNIVADVIVSLAPVLPQLLGADSRLICSGILDSRLPDVRQALNQAGLSVTKIRAKEEWRCVEVSL